MDLQISWLPRASILLSIEELSDIYLGDAWDTSYHTLRTLVGCQNPLISANVRLWRRSETALANYTYHVMREQVKRSVRMTDTLDREHRLYWAIIEDGPHDEPLVDEEFLQSSTKELKKNGLLPRWFGWKPLHESHRKAIQIGHGPIKYPWKV